MKWWRALVGKFELNCLTETNMGVVELYLRPKGKHLKRPRHGILSYFDHRQNYLEIEGNMKIIL